MPSLKSFATSISTAHAKPLMRFLGFLKVIYKYIKKILKNQSKPKKLEYLIQFSMHKLLQEGFLFTCIYIPPTSINTFLFFFPN